MSNIKQSREEFETAMLLYPESIQTTNMALSTIISLLTVIIGISSVIWLLILFGILTNIIGLRSVGIIISALVITISAYKIVGVKS